MRHQRLLKLEEHPSSKKLDEQIHNLKGTDVADHFGFDGTEIVINIQSVSVVAYEDYLHAYVLITTQTYT